MHAVVVCSETRFPIELKHRLPEILLIEKKSLSFVFGQHFHLQPLRAELTEQKKEIEKNQQNRMNETNKSIMQQLTLLLSYWRAAL